MTDQTNTTSAEVWLPLVRYENLYEISNLGRVKSYRKNLSVVQMLEGKEPQLLRCGISPEGYPRFRAYRNGVSELIQVHVAILETFVGPRPEGMVARHLNGKSCESRLDNLAWGTQKENSDDKFEHGTFVPAYTYKRR